MARFSSEYRVRSEAMLRSSWSMRPASGADALARALARAGLAAAFGTGFGAGALTVFAAPRGDFAAAPLRVAAPLPLRVVVRDVVARAVSHSPSVFSVAGGNPSSSRRWA
jgi:hypothetical protein